MAKWTRAPFLFADDVMKDAHKLQRGMAITVLNNLQLLSPTKTGRYKSNHIVSIGSPDYRYTDNVGGMGMAFSTIDGLNAESLPTIYISNSLPYAMFLELGGSSQSPNGIYSLAYEGMVAAYT